MKIGIVGGGVVGRATARCWLEHCDEVRVYDRVGERGTHSLAHVLACDFVFVCLPTPQKEGSLECDTSAVENSCGMLSSMAPTGNYILRSTVPIGTTRRLRHDYGLPNLIHSPEFLTARCSLVDAQIPSRNVIGGPAIPVNRLAEVYRKRFPGVPLILCDSDESEAVKLLTNGFFAVKVAYFNEVRHLIDKRHLCWDVVMAGVLTDGRISPSHTQVPGPDGSRGFGGTCLPKDVASLATQIANSGLDASVTLAAHLRNTLTDRPRGK